MRFVRLLFNNPEEVKRIRFRNLESDLLGMRLHYECYGLVGRSLAKRSL
jgi:hypothetical protein